MASYTTAQEFAYADNIELEAVVKTASRSLYYNEDKQVGIIDTIALKVDQSNSLDQLLAKSSFGVVSSYGAAGATSSIKLRGTSGNHTQVIWNGLRINSLTTGASDLSLIPVAFFNQVSVTYGAAGSLYGSGTFGGAIDLGNSTNWTKHFNANINTTLGSFNSYTYNASASVGGNRVQYQLKAFKYNSKNNFTYTDRFLPGKPEVKQSHNSVSNTGILQELHFRLPNKNSLHLGTWYQFKSYEIPAIMGSTLESQANQKDSLLRLSLLWEKLFNKSKLTFASGYNYNYLNYTDDAKSIDSRIEPSSFTNRLGYKVYYSEKWSFDLGAEYAHMEVSSSNYNIDNEYDFSIFAGSKYKLNNTVINTSISKVYNTHSDSPILLSAGFNHQLNNAFGIHLSVSNKYRRPTFNEKYWPGAGNPNLLPEKGIGSDFGLNWLHNTSIGTIKLSTTAFYNEINNYIQWIPSQGNSAVWVPSSYKSVVSKGLESSLCMNKTIHTIHATFQIAHVYTISESDNITLDDYSNAENKQLPYIPKNRINSSLNFVSGKFYLGFNSQYSGSYYITEDNLGSTMDSYHIINSYLGANIPLSNFSLDIKLRADNLLDKSYEVIRSYPMPGRAFHLSVGINFSK